MLGRLRTLAVLAALAVAAAAAGLYAMPVLDRDEARFAQATAQMLESGDYIRISFQDDARNKKPAGIYWLQAASVQLFSSPEARAIWAYRLPSVLGLVIAVLATYAAGCVFIGRRGAFAGAALFAVSVLAGVEGGIAKTDAMLTGLIALVMAALAALYEGLPAHDRVTHDGRPLVEELVMARYRRRSRWFCLLFWFALAAAILVKGPVAPMVVGLAVLVMVLFDRRARWLMPLLWWPGPLLAILMIAPWVYFVQRATEGSFLADALLQDLGPKLVSGHESHGAPPGAHVALTPLLSFPLVVFLVPGLVMAVRAFFRPFSDAEAAGLRFFGAWALPAWLIFELVPTKLPHYVLPLYPALALMAGAAYEALVRKKAAIVAQTISVVLFALAGGLFTAALVLLPALINTGVVLDPEFNRVVDTLGQVPAILRPLPLVVAGGLFVAPFMLWRAPRAILAIAVVAGLTFHWASRFVVIPSLDTIRVSARISETLEAYSLHPRFYELAKRPIVSAGYAEPSLVFLTDTDTVLTDGTEAARYAGVEAGRATLVESRELAAFQAELEAIGALAVQVDKVDGLNYSRGDLVSIAIYRTTQRARRRPETEDGGGGPAP